MLTVTELIGLLKKFPGGYRVVVAGYEDGFDDINSPKVVELELNRYRQNYYGPHMEAEGGSPAVALIGLRDN